jgi:CDP-glucose 4,6-dehydratase
MEGLGLDPGLWSGRRVLLTGHTGFKGSWLATWLRELGADVHGYSLPDDVRDGPALRAAVDAANPSVVLHLAAQPLVRLSYEDPVGTYDTNVIGTANLLDALRGRDLHSVVVVTSDKCYENRELGRAFVEDDPLGGHDPYSSSKAAQELVAHAYAGSYDMPLATARAGNVIGGGDWGIDRLVPDAMRAVAAGQPLRVRNPDAVRPWQHVLCPLHGYLLLAQSAQTGGWNFGPAEDESKPVRWIVEQLEIEWEQDPGDHPHEARLLSLDSTKSRTELGWDPRWDLASGLEATKEWYAAVRAGGDPDGLRRDQIATYGLRQQRPE